mgnify:CR=1 FL=1
MWKNINKDSFDLIIDDGLHNLNAAYNFFILSFKTAILLKTFRTEISYIQLFSLLQELPK